MAALAVVVVTYRSGPGVAATLRAARAQLDEGDELIVVDNASGDSTVAEARVAAPDARLVELPENLGFAGGCHAGASATTAPLLLFLNPDAVPAAGCLEALRVAAADEGLGAWQALVTLPGGETVNTWGGEVHFLGVGWAGGMGQPVAAAPSAPREHAFASGAALVVRRDAWSALGGFDPAYFMYGEDLDLGLRLWLAGWRVATIPSARVEHDYEFDKGTQKWFWLERNRWRTVLSAYPAPLLVLLAPALVAFELVLLAVAARQGWLRAKVRAQLAALRALPATLRRRRSVQATRTAPAGAFARRLTARLDSPYLDPPAGAGAAVALQSAYWRAVRAVLELGERGGGR